MADKAFREGVAFFDSLPAVQAAGGFHPFMTEVLAETRTLCFHKIQDDPEGYQTLADRDRIATESWCEVMRRRLQKDLEQEFLVEFDRRIEAPPSVGGYTVEAAWADVMRWQIDRMAKRGEAMNEHFRR